MYEHILHVLDGVTDNLVLRLAALFHDIGKPYVYTIDEEGVGHFYGHWDKSLEIFESFAKKFNISDDIKQLVSNLILYHDLNIGKLNDALKEMGILDDTIFVFTSDHDELFGAHGRRAKNIFYEEAVRVPFLMKWGNRLGVGANDVCLNSVDIMPTLLTMMDLPIPEAVEGRDLSATILGDEKAAQPTGALMMGTGATAKWEDGHEWRAFRTKQYTYAKYLADGQELLFDNIADPYQKENLIDNPAYADVLAQLKADMAAEMDRVNDHFYPSSYYEKNWVTPDRLITKWKAE